MIEEFGYAILVRDRPDLGLVAGDVGVVVLVHKDAQQKPIGYELEIFSVGGESLETVGVGLDDVRAASDNDRVHARSSA